MPAQGARACTGGGPRTSGSSGSSGSGSSDTSDINGASRHSGTSGTIQQWPQDRPVCFAVSNRLAGGRRPAILTAAKFMPWPLPLSIWQPSPSWPQQCWR
jgi:hypothetical protein